MPLTTAALPLFIWKKGEVLPQSGRDGDLSVFHFEDEDLLSLRLPDFFKHPTNY